MNDTTTHVETTLMESTLTDSTLTDSTLMESTGVPPRRVPVGLSIVVPVYRGAATVGRLVDALSDYGVDHIDMPATPERVWVAIREGQRSEAAE